MYQVFRSLSLLFMGLTAATFFFTIVLKVLGIIDHGESFSMKFFLSDPAIFSFSGFALSEFLFDSFENLEK